MANFDVRARITELIQEKGWSTAELAAKVGCDKRTVAYWKQHERAFNADMLLTVCQAFGITPNQFFRLNAPTGQESYAEAVARLQKLDVSALQAELDSLHEQQLLIELALLAAKKKG